MNHKQNNPLFDEYGIYRREAIKLQREHTLHQIALGAIAGVAIATVSICSWLLAAG